MRIFGLIFIFCAHAAFALARVDYVIICLCMTWLLVSDTPNVNTHQLQAQL